MTQYLPLIKSVDIDCTQYENVYSVESNTRCARTPVINSQVTEIELSTKTLGGGRVRVSLPMGNLLSHTVLSFKFSRTQMLALNGWTLPQGWGYDIIEYYEVQSEAGTFLRFEMQDVFTKILADCENESKREALINLGGTAFNGDVSDPAAILDLKAYVHLYLPFSNVASTKVLPYDSSILNKPMSINIQFRNASELFSRHQDQTIGTLGTRPSALSGAYLACQTGILAAGPSASLRNVVSAAGDAKYVYGWIYPNVYSTPPFTGNDTIKQSVNLENIMNGSIQSIDLLLERLTLGDAAGTTLTAENVPLNRKANYEEMSNIELSYGSQVIYRASDEIWKLMSFSEYPVSNQYSVSFFDMKLTNGPYVASTKTCFWTHVQLSQFANPHYFMNYVQDGVQLSNNMLKLSFNVPTIAALNTAKSNGDNGETIVTQPIYRIRAIYNTQAGLATYKGATDWQFMPADQRGPYTISG